VNSSAIFVQVLTVPRPPGAWTSRNHKAASGRWAFRRSPHTARSRPSGEVSESFVTVTHPFHPLAGQRLRVLFERKLPGGLAVSCEGGPLGSLMLPLPPKTKQHKPAKT
jgi:hypothetical protein